MFMSLFRHIQTNNIPMTAPVEITYERPTGDSPARPVAMAFMYGNAKIGKAGPTTRGVNVIDLPPQLFVSIGVRGGYERGNFESGLKKLDAYLESHLELKQAGPPRYLGYNSPFVPPFMRFGEVQLPVEKGNGVLLPNGTSLNR